MTADIIPSQILIVNSKSQIYLSATFPKPNFVMVTLMLLLCLTMVALVTTGLGSLVSLFFISVSLALNFIALQNEIKKLRKQEVYNDYSH